MSMSPVLMAAPLQADLAAALESEHGAVALPQGSPILEQVRVAVTTTGVGIDAAMIDRLPALEAVVNFGVGLDAIDLAACARRGVAVANTPDVLTDATADTAVALVLATLLRVPSSDRFVRSGGWADGGSVPFGRQVSGSRVGVLGLGRIGSTIARRLAAFDCPISYHNRREVADSPYEYVGSAVELAAAVDVLVVATPGGADVGVLVDADVIEALGPDGVLVNIGRGSVVDEAALVDALVEGRLGGAGLDVFADEPHVPAALLDLDHVVLLPHVGSATVETRTAMAALVRDNVTAWLQDQRLLTPVDLT